MLILFWETSNHMSCMFLKRDSQLVRGQITLSMSNLVGSQLRKPVLKQTLSA